MVGVQSKKIKLCHFHYSNGIKDMSMFVLIKTSFAKGAHWNEDIDWMSDVKGLEIGPTVGVWKEESLTVTMVTKDKQLESSMYT